MKDVSFTRRQGLGFAGLAVLGSALAACSTGTVDAGAPGTSAASSDTFPVTIKHAYGSTTIDKAATRPATVGWASQDILVGLGVLPVAMPFVSSGTSKHKSTIWFDDAARKLGVEYGGEKYPVQYSDLDGANFTDLAKTGPDVILALQSGLSQEDYDKLSKIAPVIPYLTDQYNTPWRDAVTVIGKVVGKSAQAKKQVADIDAQFKSVTEKNSQLTGTVFINAALAAGDKTTLWLYGPQDLRSQFLKDLGMTASATAYPAGAERKRYHSYYSVEKAGELTSDIVVNWAAAGRSVEKILADPLLSQMPALAHGALVNEQDSDVNWAMTTLNPLSIKFGFDKFVPPLLDAVNKAKGR